QQRAPGGDEEDRGAAAHGTGADLRLLRGRAGAGAVQHDQGDQGLRRPLHPGRGRDEQRLLLAQRLVPHPAQGAGHAGAVGQHQEAHRGTEKSPVTAGTIMAKKTTAAAKPEANGDVLRQPAEVKYRDELDYLAAADTSPRPFNWKLSPRLVRTFILGSRPGDGLAPQVRAECFGGPSPLTRAGATLAAGPAPACVGQ